MGGPFRECVILNGLLSQYVACVNFLRRLFVRELKLEVKVGAELADKIHTFPVSNMGVATIFNGRSAQGLKGGLPGRSSSAILKLCCSPKSCWYQKATAVMMKRGIRNLQLGIARAAASH